MFLQLIAAAALQEGNTLAAACSTGPNKKSLKDMITQANLVFYQTVYHGLSCTEHVGHGVQIMLIL